MSRIRIAFSCLFLASSSLSAAAAILTEIQLKTDPDTVRVRPFDSLFVQVLAYAEVRRVQTPEQLSTPASEDFVQQQGFQQTLQARTKDYDPKARKGQFDLRLRIDEEVEVLVRGGSIHYEVIGGREPCDDGSEYSQEIPRAIFKKFEVEKKDGRGNILVLETPSIQNEFHLKMRFIDRKGGEDGYHA